MDELRAAAVVPVSQLHAVCAAMGDGLVAGLAADDPLPDLFCIPSFVMHLPTGIETGTFYALDLGGSNLRALRVVLDSKPHEVEKLDAVSTTLPADLLARGSCEGLFRFIAETVVGFAGREARGSLGFTFSFACKQTALDAGTLVTWTKSFHLSDGPGLEVVGLLRTALAAAGSRLSVVALLNDCVGTFAAARHSDPRVLAAVIVGTGTNCAYEERLSRVPKWKGPVPPGEHSKMVINTEWGNLAAVHLPSIAADAALDARSPNVGQQAFEKRIAGMYLGRLGGDTIAAEERVRPFLGPRGAEIADALASGGALTTPRLSSVANRSPGARDDLTTALGCGELPDTAWATVEEACDLITRRAGRLAAAGLAAVLIRARAARDDAGAAGGGGGGGGGGGSSAAHAQPRDVVAVDGGLFEHHAGFRSALEAALAEMGFDDVDLHLTKDGSGVGAALLAAAAEQADTLQAGEGE